MLKIHPLRKGGLRVWGLMLGIALSFSGLPAHAEEDLFLVEKGQWMSFDHYKDAVDRGIVVQSQPASSVPSVEAPPVVSSAQEAGATPSLAAASGIPAIAAPKRPVLLPLLPGMNKGFGVEVSSTEDDSANAPPPVVDKEGKADLKVSTMKWQNPSSRKVKESEGETNLQLNVRMSFLPDGKTTPIPSAEPALSAQQKARQALVKELPKKDKKSVDEAAVCAAIDLYKKQQLDAIQSDRETLKALQDAVKALGLEKQLGFMTQKSASLDASEARVDMPAAQNMQNIK